MGENRYLILPHYSQVSFLRFNCYQNFAALLIGKVKKI